MSNEIYMPGGDEINMDFWMRKMSDVNRCGDEMLALSKKYGDVVFFVNIEIFHEHMPDAMLVVVERLKYLNSRLKEKSQGVSKQFKIHGLKGNE